MSSFFIDKTDPQIAEILDRLKRVNKILQKTETLVQPTLNNERFLTDEELSKILRVSRRTLQEYRLVQYLTTLFRARLFTRSPRLKRFSMIPINAA